MSIGLAVVICFVLHLIDCHNLWRKVAKLTMWLTLVGVLIAGGVYGWTNWTANRSAAKRISTGWTDSRIDVSPAESKPDPLDSLGVPAFPRTTGRDR